VSPSEGAETGANDENLKVCLEPSGRLPMLEHLAYSGSCSNQDLDTDVPVEQVEGTLLPPEQPVFGSKSELSPGELKTLGVEKGTLLHRQEALQRSLPPIYVTMESGSYEQVATTVPVKHHAGSATQSAYHRRSLSSRSGHLNQPFVSPSGASNEGPTTRVVYRNIYHSSRKSVDIAP